MLNEREIAKQSKSSFYYAFALLPLKKRVAMNIIYSFCRLTDDIADSNKPLKEKQLELRNWKKEFEKSLNENSEFSLLNNLSKVIKEFSIPKDPFLHLIEGMEDDLANKKYYTWDDLREYCYKVASTVGIMSIHIFGFERMEIEDYAVNLGIALQLTNILRDISEDLDNNRIYLPEEDFERFNYTVDDLKHKKYNHQFVNLMEFQYKRALDYYKKTDIIFTPAERKNLFPAEAMKIIYFKNLQKIKDRNYNVFDRKIKIGKLQKIYLSVFKLLRTYLP